MIAPRPGSLRPPSARSRRRDPQASLRADHPPVAQMLRPDRRTAGPVPRTPRKAGRAPPAVLPLPTSRMRIGRTDDNDLVLSDLSVSKRHAELRKTSDGKYQIADLGSHNGTFVNGQ